MKALTATDMTQCIVIYTINKDFHMGVDSSKDQFFGIFNRVLKTVTNYQDKKRNISVKNL